VQNTALDSGWRSWLRRRFFVNTFFALDDRAMPLMREMMELAAVSRKEEGGACQIESSRLIVKVRRTNAVLRQWVCRTAHSNDHRACLSRSEQSGARRVAVI
jgi:hypothetical protein